MHPGALPGRERLLRSLEILVKDLVCWSRRRQVTERRRPRKRSFWFEGGPAWKRERARLLSSESSQPSANPLSQHREGVGHTRRSQRVSQLRAQTTDQVFLSYLSTAAPGLVGLGLTPTSPPADQLFSSEALGLDIKFQLPCSRRTHSAARECH